MLRFSYIFSVRCAFYPHRVRLKWRSLNIYVRFVFSYNCSNIYSNVTLPSQGESKMHSKDFCFGVLGSSSSWNVTLPSQGESKMHSMDFSLWTFLDDLRPEGHFTLTG